MADEQQLVEELAKIPTVQPEQKKDDEKVWSWAWIIVAFVIGVMVGGGGVAVISNIQYPISNKVKPTPTVTAAVTVTPAPTPIPLERSEVKVQVLNGSGVTGAAGKAKDFLENLGYEDVAVGNAAEKDATTVQIKKTKESFLITFTNDLSGKYKASSSSADLSPDSDFDVVLTLGTN